MGKCECETGFGGDKCDECYDGYTGPNCDQCNTGYYKPVGSSDCLGNWSNKTATESVSSVHIYSFSFQNVAVTRWVQYLVQLVVKMVLVPVYQMMDILGINAICAWKDILTLVQILTIQYAWVS